MNSHFRDLTRLFALVALCCGLLSCAAPAPTMPAISIPEDAPPDVSKLTLSRSRLSQGGNRTMLVLLSQGTAVVSRTQSDLPVVKYCVAKGEAPSNLPNVSACSTTVDTIYRVPFLEHHRGDIDVETKCRAENPVRVIRFQHKASFSALVSRVHPHECASFGRRIRQASVVASAVRHSGMYSVVPAGLFEYRRREHYD